jgi:hypothetical protein
MQYHVGCRCGQQLAVTADQAGTTVRCECGESVTVPSLSKLRAAAGIGSYESGTIDTIRRMLAEGTLPWGETCAVTGRPTRDVIRIEVQCEHLHSPEDPVRFALLLGLCVGPWATLLLYGRGRDQPQGRDTVVTVPLLVCREYQIGLDRWWKKRGLRRLLRTVPVYARLLDEYSKATLAMDETLVDIEDLDP